MRRRRELPRQFGESPNPIIRSRDGIGVAARTIIRKFGGPASRPGLRRLRLAFTDDRHRPPPDYKEGDLGCHSAALRGAGGSAPRPAEPPRLARRLLGAR